MARADLSSHSQPVLTIRIGRTTALLLSVGALLLTVVLFLDNRAHRSTPLLAPVAAQTDHRESTATPVVSVTDTKSNKVVPSKAVTEGTTTENFSQRVIVAPSRETLAVEQVETVNPQPVPVLVAVPQAEPLKAAASGILNGAGATYPYPLYESWFRRFHEEEPDIQINYQPIGSGGGVRQLLARAVDFAATDSPVPEGELSRFHRPILHIPATLQAVALVFHLPGTTQLRLTPDAVAGIFLGNITTWNDPAIANANRNLHLPEQPIVVVHRSDGCATTSLFTEYLSSVSDEWRGAPGTGTSVKWPIGLGGTGNEGVAGQVEQIEGAIGYIDFRYLPGTAVAVASVRNAAGNFVHPTVRSVAAAAASTPLPEDLCASLVNAPGNQSYSIVGLSWLLVPTELKASQEGRAMLRFLYWMTNQGQAMSKQLGYPPLPLPVTALVQKKIAHLQ